MCHLWSSSISTLSTRGLENDLCSILQPQAWSVFLELFVGDRLNYFLAVWLYPSWHNPSCLLYTSSLYITCLFSLTGFKLFLLLLVLRSLIIWFSLILCFLCLGFLELFALVGLWWPLFLQMSFLSDPYSPPGTPITFILGSSKLSHSTLILCSFFLVFLSLFHFG